MSDQINMTAEERKLILNAELKSCFKNKEPKNRKAEANVPAWNLLFNGKVNINYFLPFAWTNFRTKVF